MQPIINVAGNATFSMTPEENKVPSIPINQFLQKTYLDIHQDLLIFNTFVQESLSKHKGIMATEAMDKLKTKAKNLEDLVKTDYSPSLVTEYAVDIAALAVQMIIHYGGELQLKNG